MTIKLTILETKMFYLMKNFLVIEQKICLLLKILIKLIAVLDFKLKPKTILTTQLICKDTILISFIWEKIVNHFGSNKFNIIRLKMHSNVLWDSQWIIVIYKQI